MRLREVSTGIVVSVDDARGAAMVGPHWEPANKSAQPDHKETDSAPRAKRTSRKPRT
jgi:hypothetical protein